MLTWGSWSFNTSNVFPVFCIKNKNKKKQTNKQTKQKGKLLKYNKAHTMIFKKFHAQIADSKFNEMHKMLNFNTIKINKIKSFFFI